MRDSGEANSVEMANASEHFMRIYVAQQPIKGGIRGFAFVSHGSLGYMVEGFMDRFSSSCDFLSTSRGLKGSVSLKINSVILQNKGSDETEK
jgi:hypothetical protein